MPERAISLSPSLAATIGLEEALLLQHLQGLEQAMRVSGTARASTQAQADSWTSCTLAGLAGQLPFWAPAALGRILRSLIDLGMLQVDTLPADAATLFKFSLETSDANLQSGQSGNVPALPRDTRLGASRIPADWQPDREVLATLKQSGIAESFAFNELPEFVLYWRERNEVSYSWASKFLQHVTRRWQQQLQKGAEQTMRLARAAGRDAQSMNQGWQPSEDALEILDRMGINANFIEDAIPEFVLHWSERGVAEKTWNSKFVNHIKYQWAKYNNAIAHNTEPLPIPQDWQPDDRVIEVLLMSNIDEDFAKSLVPEFVMYWRDRNELHHSWPTKFLQYVKMQWARNHGNRDHAKDTHAEGSAASRKTRDRTIFEDLSDRSWASGDGGNG